MEANLDFRKRRKNSLLLGQRGIAILCAHWWGPHPGNSWGRDFSCHMLNVCVGSVLFFVVPNKLEDQGNELEWEFHSCFLSFN